MEYRITLAADRCTALTLRFFWVPFRNFRPFSCPFIYTYRTAVSEVSKVRPISAYWWNLILFVARRVIESLLHKEETSLNICGKEADLARNLFHKQRICHQKSINIQQNFRLGRRATLYRKGLYGQLYEKYYKMFTSKNDRQDKNLTGQALDQAGHCPLTGRYFEPWRR